MQECVNNYEGGPWEALEEMKDDVNYKEFIRLNRKHAGSS